MSLWKSHIEWEVTDPPCEHRATPNHTTCVLHMPTWMNDFIFFFSAYYNKHLLIYKRQKEKKAIGGSQKAYLSLSSTEKQIDS